MVNNVSLSGRKHSKVRVNRSQKIDHSNSRNDKERSHRRKETIHNNDSMSPKCPSLSPQQEIEEIDGQTSSRHAPLSHSDTANDSTWWEWISGDYENDIGMIYPRFLCEGPEGACSAETQGDKDVHHPNNSNREHQGPKFDFAVMHAMLIEALLEEQRHPKPDVNNDNENDNSVEMDRNPYSKETDSKGSNGFLGRSKRRREQSVPFLMDSDNTFSSMESSRSMSSTSTFLPSPGSFLSTKCRMQKDKGSGHEPGTAANIHGREATLEKLRAKTCILSQAVSDGDSMSRHPFGKLAPAGKAEMRRGPVKLTALDPPETRSVLEVRMGFLSLKYGILLRWEADEGLVDLVVMRKMATSNFMSVDSVDLSKYRRPLKRNLSDAGPLPGNRENLIPDEEDPIGVIRPHSTIPMIEKMETNDSFGNMSKEDTELTEENSQKNSSYTINKITHGRSGSNASIELTSHPPQSMHRPTLPQLSPPYLVSRPDQFPPSTLSVTVLRARGLLRRKKHLSVYVSLSTSTDRFRTSSVKMSRNPVWKEDHVRSSHLNIHDEMDDVLKISIYEKRHVLKDRIISILYLPLELLEPVRDMKKVAPTEVTIPCRIIDKGGPFGSITLALTYESYYKWWIQEEVRSRQLKDRDKPKTIQSTHEECGKGTTEKEVEIVDLPSQLDTYLFCCFDC